MFALPVATDPQPALNAAEARWAEGGLTDYRFHVQRSCFCPSVYTRRYRIDVVDGKAVGAPEWIDSFNTVPKLFAAIQRTIDGEGTVEVSYASSGLPTSVSADPIPRAIDDEYGIRVGGLKETDGTPPRPVDDGIEDGTAAAALAEARRRWSGPRPLPRFTLVARAIRRRYSALEVTYAKSGRPRRVFADPDARVDGDETRLA